MKQRAIRPGQIVLLLAIALVHVSAWFAYYGDLPAGQYPTEEARAAISAANAIAAGTPTSASDHVGNSLYTYTLAIFAVFSATDADITTAARALNALALLWITGACASAASRYWQSNRAVWIAGLLVGLNPVLVFWAAEISPALLSSACVSTALAALLPWYKTTNLRSSLVIALSFTLAAALQTVLLPFALLWPVFALLYPVRKKIAHLCLAALPPILLFVLLLLTNLSLETPWQWVEGSATQEAARAYAALANPEIPQSKSFALYRELHLLLFLNPIHWSALFILAAIGFYARLRERPWSPTALVAIAMLLLFSISFALNDGGSQTRASVIPLIAIFAAGAYQLPRLWHHSGSARRLRLIAAGFFIFAFSYAAHLASDPTEQWEADYIYLAQANLAMDQNRRATTWAKKALGLNPSHLDTQAVLVEAQFNSWALSSQPATLPVETAREYLAATEPVQNKSTLRTIRAIYKYKLRNTEEALVAWRAEQAVCPLAQLCLYWTGRVQKVGPEDLEDYPKNRYRDLLADAIQIDRSALQYTDLEKQIDNLLALAY